MYRLSSFLVLAVACGSTTDSVSEAGSTLVDHEGQTITIRSGFTDTYEYEGDTLRVVVLTNMMDGCASLNWWDQREESLSDLFFSDPFDEAGFEEAIDNTGSVFADEMSTDSPWYAVLDVGVQSSDTEHELEGATPSSEWGDPVFWGWAVSMTAPTFESEQTTGGGFSRTWGPDGYEADSTGGQLTVTFDGDGARGSIDTTFETDTLAQFDILMDFDVPACSGAY
jgi:hypothetical protein